MEEQWERSAPAAPRQTMVVDASFFEAFLADEPPVAAPVAAPERKRALESSGEPSRLPPAARPAARDASIAAYLAAEAPSVVAHAEAFGVQPYVLPAKPKAERSARAAAAPRAAAPRAPRAPASAMPLPQEAEPAEAEEAAAALPPTVLELPSAREGAEPLSFDPRAQPLGIPGDLAARLRPFQLDGVRFLHKRWCLGPGCLLADDMGLGKTIQTIAFLAALMGKTDQRGDAAHAQPRTGHRALVVVPKALLRNWKEELQKWASFSVAEYHGGGTRAAALGAAERGEVEVLVTTPAIFTTHVAALQRVAWSVLVFDEAHKMQNYKTRFCEAVAAEGWDGGGGAFKLLLTGTPGANNLMDLYTLLDIAVPECLGERARFKEYYELPIKEGSRVDASQAELAIKLRRSAEVKRIVETHMLRRKKDNAEIMTQLEAMAMGLPKKSEKILLCGMSPLQKRAYERMLGSEDFALLRRYHELCDCGSGAERGVCCHSVCDGPFFNMKDHAHCREGGCPSCLIFNFLHLATHCGNHLELIKADPKGEDEPTKLRNARVAAAILGPDAEEAGGVWATDSWERLADTGACGKLGVLASLLASWSAPGSTDKVLLFSYSVRLLRILESFLAARSYTFVRLDGTMSAAERARVVDEFNSRPSTFICLVSVMAGGVGLNLTSANKVIIFDPNWNPANDMQAQDRAYRIGQKRDVAVYRLIAANTVEEVQYLRQLFKQGMSNSIAGGVERRLFKGMQGDSLRPGELWGLLNLFAVDEGGSDVRLAAIRKRAETCDAKYVVLDWSLADEDEEGADEEEAEEAEEAEEEAAEEVEDEEAALVGVGVLYQVQHQKVLGAGKMEARVNAAALAATVAHEDVPVPCRRLLKLHQVAPPQPRAAGAGRLAPAPAAAPTADEAAALLQPMADRFEEGDVRALAARLLDVGQLGRANLVDVFLRAHGRFRGD